MFQSLTKPSRHKDVVSMFFQLNSNVGMTSRYSRNGNVDTTSFQRLIEMSRQRCINVRTTIKDVHKRLFERCNATLERRRTSTLYQHFHCDYIAMSGQRRYLTSLLRQYCDVRSTLVFDVIYGCLNVVILRCLDVI